MFLLGFQNQIEKMLSRDGVKVESRRRELAVFDLENPVICEPFVRHV